MVEVIILYKITILLFWMLYNILQMSSILKLFLFFPIMKTQWGDSFGNFPKKCRNYYNSPIFSKTIAKIEKNSTYIMGFVFNLSYTVQISRKSIYRYFYFFAKIWGSFNSNWHKYVSYVNISINNVCYVHNQIKLNGI